MKPLTPKDASILAVIAENARLPLARVENLIQIADDVEEVRAVARQLLNGATQNGTGESEQAQRAKALRTWVEENRSFSHSR